MKAEIKKLYDLFSELETHLENDGGISDNVEKTLKDIKEQITVISKLAEQQTTTV